GCCTDRYFSRHKVLFWLLSKEQNVTKRTTFKLFMLCAFAVTVLTVALMPGGVSLGGPEPVNLGYSTLPDGRGGTNVEAAVYTKEMGFDKERSLAAFKETLYPVLRQNCSGCHSTQNKSGSGAQAPVHADVDVNLAHEYALTRVNFREPAESKFVVRMA